MPDLTPTLLLAAALTLLPLLAAAFFPHARSVCRRLPLPIRIVAPLLLCLPYLLVTTHLRWSWLSLYALLPIAVAILLHHAARIDPHQRGAWPDLVVLATLGLAVDLRWFESAWPPHLAVFNKMLLLDTGIWGFLVVRNLHNTGFDLRLRLRDLRIGMREFAFYTPIAIALGFALHFLHLHLAWPDPILAIGSFLFTFFFIAVPEELFFRGWIQNLLERRIGRTPALLVTAALFGLSHFNKRAAHFNWRYVLLAAIAGIFYGRAWRLGGRHTPRVAASALTHASVDTLWSLFLR